MTKHVYVPNQNTLVIPDNKYDFTEPSGRAKFISEQESSIYIGHNQDHEQVMIFLEKGVGCIIKTKHRNKPKWWECLEYDKDGYLIGESYEPDN